jgi:purine/pyrimidine-nucleoside phosphorylase
MIKLNEYFDGNVKSLALENTEGTSTVGVMAPGAYEFGTSTVEHMTVVSGSLTVKLPGQADWKTFKANDTFIVDKNQKFQLKVTEFSAYLCKYK